MEKNKGKKSRFIIGIVSVVVLIALVAIYLCVRLGVFENNRPLYGIFECEYEDGKIGQITLREDSVYCDNIDYQSSENEAATSMAMADMGEKKVSLTDEEFQKKHEMYVAQLDFKKLYDKKDIKITKTEYVEGEWANGYRYYVANPETGGEGMYLYYDIETRTLSVGQWVYEYAGKE